MGHLQVLISLYFKASLHAKSLLWVSVFIHFETITNISNLEGELRTGLPLWNSTEALVTYVFFFSVANLQNRRKTLVHILRPPSVFPNLRFLSWANFRKFNTKRIPQASSQMLYQHWPRSLKQALWRRQKERRLARAFCIFVHFAAALVVSTSWNDLF